MIHLYFNDSSVVFSQYYSTLCNVPGSQSHRLQMWKQGQTVEPQSYIGLADFTCYFWL